MARFFRGRHKRHVNLEADTVPMRRLAVVIGISDYSNRPLTNAVSDACKAASALERRGFVATLVEDADQSTIAECLGSLAADAKQADIALVYLAGHAIERNGTGYFLPRDFPFPVSAPAARLYGISLAQAVGAVSSANVGVVILDACRNWPASVDDEDLLKQLDADAASEREWRNTLLVYSTSSASAASDGPPGAGSEFCKAFCQHILDHSLGVDECFRRIAQDVVRRSARQQQPWTYSSLEQSLSFSDLPKFYSTRRQKTQNFGSWSVPDHNRSGIFAGADNESIWHATAATVERVGFIRRNQIVGAATPGKHLLVATANGNLLDAADGGRLMVATKLKPSHGLATSPNGTSLALYGNGKTHVFLNESGNLRWLHQIDTGFDTYCCAYLTDDLMWLAGENGRIVSVDLRKLAPVATEVVTLGDHINSLTPSPDRKSVYCAGQKSLLSEVEISGARTRRILENHRPTTPSGIYAMLSQIAGDSLIHTYLFNRNELPQTTISALEERVKGVDFTSCAHAFNLPILAVGTNESTVLMVDTRDGQIIQEIEVSNGFAGNVAGLTFLSDRELVVLSYDGTVSFLSGRFQ
ncbi:caspase family protein [Mesorhizobium sp. GbtcB19]|uniref:caspase family protein n=1 Tax=Mesorhizobium sp. GbtcB19 TaxID=2824764 RepID=UPI001C2F8EF1|nr:caspase family protein [Mesorhizobium sp. GbtcB19]